MSKKTKKLSKKDSRKLEIDKFKSHVLEASDTYGKDPSLVTLSEFNEFSDFSEWDLRKLGGFGNLKKLLFPMEEKDVSFERESAKARSYISKLEKELGDKISLENEIRDSIVKNIKPVKVSSYKPKSTKVKKTRDVVAMLNDTHIGLIVKPEEVNNLNKFDFTIASRRIGFFIDEVCKYKLSKRDEVGTLHLLLNGDLIAGIIHGLQGRDLEMLTHQFNGAVHILSNAVSRVAENFRNVKVYFSTGNHGDSPHRREGSRVLSQIYDSIEGQIFYAVSAAHRQTKNVKFEAGHTLYQDIQLPAGRAIMTHGHLMFSSALGNPGTTVNSKSLGVALSDFNAGERRQGKDEVKLVLVGHCVPESSDVLTKDGWKKISEINSNTEFITMNRETQEFEPQKATSWNLYDKIEYPEIYNLKNTHINFSATDKHGMFYYKYRDKKTLNLCELKNVPNKGWMRVSGFSKKSGIELSNDEIKFLVNIVSDGYIDPRGYLRFHFKKDRKIKNLKNILDNLGIKYTVQPNSKTTKIYIGLINDKYKKYIDVWKKTWTRNIVDMSHKQVDVFLNEYYITDGHKYENSVGQIYTNKKDQVDIIQEILCTSGFKTKVYLKKDLTYTINVNKKELVMFNEKQLTKIKNNEHVWCVTVPNGSLIIRNPKDNTILITQNTHSHFHITTREGVQVYNAPSLSGIDSFAYSIGINYNLTGQVMFESTKDYILGDSRLLHVASADNNPEYDKVIPVYKKELVYKS